ncbi:MAG: DUF937 domain-containing protein [Xanthomonadales bacterium]|nr:DUF937 domain-containing protein [Gammaproteobacteria bacterium]NNE05304.1 DUF937 domain-containing protein [Xanthomonadales bacterium]NNL95208.1 DUF937 domain-containing protein [Xanthomonadales bacterium]
MDLLKTILGAAGNSELSSLGSQFGLDASAVEKVMEQVVPALGRGLQKNTARSGGLENLASALQRGSHEKYLRNPQVAATREGIEEGNGILGHILGSKDVSRNVAAHAAANTGISVDAIKKLLPVAATMAMGALSKKTNSGAQLQQLSGGQEKQSLLGSLLDSDNDGSALDDVLDIAKRFF